MFSLDSQPKMQYDDLNYVNACHEIDVQWSPSYVATLEELGNLAA